MEWLPENVSRRDFGGTSVYVAGPGKEFLTSWLNGESRVLADFGVWTGRNLPPLIELAGVRGLVHGYDHPNARPAIEQARALHPQVEFHEGELTDLPFWDQVFSGGLCWRVLHNLKERGQLERALRELHRVLKPEAPFLVAVRSFDYHQMPRPILLRTQNPAGVERFDLCFSELTCCTVFAQAGFKVHHLELVTEEGCSDGMPYPNVYWACHLVRQ